jgi:hypothetical protein
LGNRNLFISGSCPILVLTTVLGRPRHNDDKNDIKHYQVTDISVENAIRKIPPHVFCFKVLCDYHGMVEVMIIPEFLTTFFKGSPSSTTSIFEWQ